MKLRLLLEIPVTMKYQIGTCHTGVKVVRGQISHVEKGKWSDQEQDWEPIVVMKNGDRFMVSMPIYNKLVAVERVKEAA